MLSVLDSCSIIRVQTWDAEALVPSGLERSLGIAWPRHTGSVVNGRVDIICIGPTDWLVMDGNPDATQLMNVLAEAFGESVFRATNVSQSLVRIGVDGPPARELLSKGCSLDLHPSRFAPGRAARTRFAGMPVIVRCTQESTFECIVASSYGEYLVAWLTDAALEFSVSFA
jgi:sarcosine oxidase, subunit gamma